MESNVPLVDEASKQKTEALKPEKKLTREQLRYKERVEKEAMTQLSHFLSKFYEFFMENDPESEEIAKKRKELSAKWKMYCHNKHLSQKALGLLDENCQAVIDKYKETLNDEKPVNAGYGREAEGTHPNQDSVLKAAKEDSLI